MGDQLIKFPLKQLMAEYTVAMRFACSGECVCTLHYHEYDKPSLTSEALNIQCRHKKTNSF